jgi:2-hydroxy-6-oxonona-2,4-dienedioate hydrolase
VGYSSIWTDLIGATFAQKWVQAGGIRTRCLEAGDRGKPALVFIHGTGGHAEAYVRNLGPHSEHFHVYSVDMVGHGFTDKPDQSYNFIDLVHHLRDFLDAERIDRVSLSGESMGAGIAAWFALTYPERVDKIVLNTGAALRLDQEVVERLARLSIDAVRNATEETVRKRLEFLMKDPSDVTVDMVATRLAIYRQPELVDRMPKIFEARHTDPKGQDRNCLTEEHWRTFKPRTLVLWTSDDPTAPAAAGRQVADWIPDSRFVVMDNCGHWPQYEDAETFNRIHLDFLLGRD